MTREEKSKVELTELAERLWSDTGNITNIPEFQKSPSPLQTLVEEFQDVFSDQISERPMTIEPVQLLID